ncbi:MAG: hypothetical protein MUF80_11775 [Burkholderiales bacterium]|jgi:hypothetical protein|nr:hypothetical protein [Burkholderiales bacterium]
MTKFAYPSLETIAALPDALRAENIVTPTMRLAAEVIERQAVELQRWRGPQFDAIAKERRAGR